MTLEDAPMDAMLKVCRKTGTSGIGWDQWTRDMLIAFIRNRPELHEELIGACTSTIKPAAEAAFHE